MSNWRLRATRESATLRPAERAKSDAELATDEALARLESHRDELPTQPEIHIDIHNDQRSSSSPSKLPAWLRYLLPALATAAAAIAERLLNG